MSGSSLTNRQQIQALPDLRKMRSITASWGGSVCHPVVMWLSKGIWRMCSAPWADKEGPSRKIMGKLLLKWLTTWEKATKAKWAIKTQLLHFPRFKGTVNKGCWEGFVLTCETQLRYADPAGWGRNGDVWGLSSGRSSLQIGSPVCLSARGTCACFPFVRTSLYKYPVLAVSLWGFFKVYLCCCRTKNVINTFL